MGVGADEAALDAAIGHRGDVNSGVEAVDYQAAHDGSIPSDVQAHRIFVAGDQRAVQDDLEHGVDRLPDGVAVGPCAGLGVAVQRRAPLREGGQRRRGPDGADALRVAARVASGDVEGNRLRAIVLLGGLQCLA